MELTNVWGQGQLFAYSALLGKSLISDDFAGYLSADRIGIIFCTKKRRELVISVPKVSGLSFDAVTSDYIKFRIGKEPAGRIIYARNHLIAGDCPKGFSPSVLCDTTDKAFDSPRDCIIHDTKDGDVTVLKVCGNRFAFAYAHSVESAMILIKEGLALDLDTEEAKKCSFYNAHSKPVAKEYEKLYTKCLSVMLTQLYSPEGKFKTIWSTPDRLPHKKLWLWDSVFHAVGFRNVDADLAKDLIRAIFAHQDESGFIPHMASVDVTSKITQPPVIAWGALKVYEKSADKVFLKEVFEANEHFLQWCHESRRLEDLSFTKNSELYTWNITDDVNCRCDESGMDNSPRFDVQARLCAIDFSCFMANDVNCMATIANILGNKNAEKFYKDWYREISEDINHVLWSEKDGFYFDYNTAGYSLHKVSSVASFLPLFAGVCDKKQAAELVNHLTDKSEFATSLPIPSISLKDATYGSDMWRGPVWINYNVMIAEGLRKYGFDNEADYILKRTVECMNHWYEQTGCIFEFYDSAHKKAPSRLNRKGAPFEPYNFDVRYQAIRDYGWSTTLLLDILSNYI